MSLVEIVRRVDDAILDGCFQPIADRLPHEVTPWSVGTSFHVGAILFYLTSFLGPVIFYGASFDVGMEILLAIAWIVTLVLVFQRFRSLVKPDTLNPVRIIFRSLRLWSLAILLYSIYSLNGGAGPMWLWECLGILARVALVVGLYFMACQPRPPSARRTSRAWRGIGRRAVEGSSW